jgi:HPt (histidine-containing phosphotransfer) domain-containing protein
MDDYLAKPIHDGELVRVLLRWAPSPGGANANPDELPVQTPGKTGVEDLVPGYLAARRQDLLLLAEAVEKADMRTVCVIGHRMKGSGTGYGFPAITEIGRGIEQSARSEDADGIKGQIAELEAYLKCVNVACP